KGAAPGGAGWALPHCCGPGGRSRRAVRGYRYATTRTVKRRSSRLDWPGGIAPPFPHLASRDAKRDTRRYRPPVTPACQRFVGVEFPNRNFQGCASHHRLGEIALWSHIKQGVFQSLGCPGKLGIRRVGHATEGERLLNDVAARGDVGGFVHGNDMRVRVGDVAPGEGKCDARYPIKPLQGARQPLSEQRHRRRQLCGRFVETGKMLLRHDLCVPGPDWATVEKSHQAIVLVDDVCGDLALCDPTEHALCGHRRLPQAAPLNRPHDFSDSQSRRSSRKRSAGAAELMARTRDRRTPVHWKPHFSSTRRDAGLLTRAPACSVSCCSSPKA